MIALEVVWEITVPGNRVDSMTGIILAKDRASALMLWGDQLLDQKEHCILKETKCHEIPDTEKRFKKLLDKCGDRMWTDDYYLNELYHYIHRKI